jgi:hypothetical protein
MLHIGVKRPENGKLDAHAWVESEGRVIVGQLGDLSRFSPLMPLGKEEP